MNHTNEVSKQILRLPQLSVVVCTYNRANLLKDCLASLVRQTLASSEYEIIVVDNNSLDETASLVSKLQREYPFISYIFESRQGVSYARDTGWRNAKGGYIAYIDDDTVAIPEWCERILTAFTTVVPKPVAVGGDIIPRLDRRTPWWFSPRLEVRTWGNTSGFLTSKTAHYGFSGANMSIERQALLEHNGFNHNYGMCGEKIWLGEEPELFMRIYEKQPYFWFDPAIQVKHYVAENQLNLRNRLYRKFQVGRTRRQLDGKAVSFRKVFKEVSGVLHLLKEKCIEKPFSFSYVIVSAMERVADRTGYFSGKVD